MRRAWIAVIALALLAMPGVALAHGGDRSESGEKNRSKACKALRAEMGADLFKDTYGRNPNKRNAHGKCVSKHRHVFKKLVAQAIEECKAQRAAARFRHFKNDDDRRAERVPAVREGQAARAAGRTARGVRGRREGLRRGADG